MNKEKLEKIKENVYTRCNITIQAGIGLTSCDKEEIELIDEITQLTNNWNELEEWVKQRIDKVKYNSYDEVLDKMKEIKESNNE